MSDQPLEGAVALVTGAGSGIGAATAHRLAREGAAVALVGERLHQVADGIAKLGGHAVEIPLDITEPDKAEEAVQDTLDRLGRLDVLVNNADLRLLDTALHTTVDEWDRMVALNVAALLHITHAAVPQLIYAASTSPRQVADLVNLGSTAGRAAPPGSSVYSFTKSGLKAFSESLRQELHDEQVRVSVVETGTVETGTVETELLDRPSEIVHESARRRIAGIEGLRADDIADAIGYIVTRDRRIAVNEMLIRAGDEQ
ncbi:SDR family NAD(P)-dependent oxidoreductase [Spirillospora sp. NPDC052242]